MLSAQTWKCKLSEDPDSEPIVRPLTTEFRRRIESGEIGFDLSKLIAELLRCMATFKGGTGLW